MKSLQETYAAKSACFGCGPTNAQGLRIRSFVEGDMLICDWTAQKHHEAFDNVLNGGIIGALLDCHCNWAAVHHFMKARGLDAAPACVTADYAIVLKRPCPTSGPVHLEAKVIESTGDKA